MILNPNGRFTWRNDPGMNPQLAIPWQVMVDYTTSENAAVAPQGRYLSDALKHKLLAKKPLTMYSIGTSITEGAHTLAKYYRNSDESVYPRLVAKAITRLHGSEVTLHNIAVGGSTSALLTSKTDYLLEQRPDVVLIEFGMNEHLPGAGMDRYLTGIEQAVKKLRAAGIGCVLIGFFQQNPHWDLEDVPSTKYFNNRLREMAERNHVYFADIHARFENIPAEKRYRDLMGDYLHHPTAFGHQLYYLSTMPVFLFKQSRESVLLGAIAP
jgi:lysophospholipase L1-like esterase